MNLSLRIRQQRERRGWSQEDLAQRARISRPYLARLETGRQDPRVSMLVRIAKALGVKAGRLLE